MPRGAFASLERCCFLRSLRPDLLLARVAYDGSVLASLLEACVGSRCDVPDLHRMCLALGERVVAGDLSSSGPRLGQLLWRPVTTTLVSLRHERIPLYGVCRRSCLLIEDAAIR